MVIAAQRRTFANRFDGLVLLGPQRYRNGTDQGANRFRLGVCYVRLLHSRNPISAAITSIAISPVAVLIGSMSILPLALSLVSVV